MARDRCIERGQDPDKDAEMFRIVEDCCRLVKELTDVPHVDTDALTLEQVADRLAALVEQPPRS